MGNAEARIGNPEYYRQLEDENERLRAALQRIDEINDDPSWYNSRIDLVIRAALDETQYEQEMAREHGPDFNRER